MGNSPSRSKSKLRRDNSVVQTSGPSMPEPEPAPPPPYEWPREPSRNPFLAEPVDNTFGAGSQHTFHFVDTEATAGPSTRRWKSHSDLRTPVRQETAEDALEMLKKFDTILVVDDSASMQGQRWAEATNALKALADTAGNYDTDGIDIHFLNNKRTGSNMRSGQAVQELFNRVKPSGATPIGTKLEELLRDHLSKIEKANMASSGVRLEQIKPVNFIIITDGAATDDPESVIVANARRLDKGNFPLSQVGIQFVQIGNDVRAAKFLAKLDDDLSRMNGIRDIVDTTEYGRMDMLTGDVLIKILLGGINRRVDKGGAAAIS